MERAYKDKQDSMAYMDNALVGNVPNVSLNSESMNNNEVKNFNVSASQINESSTLIRNFFSHKTRITK